MCCSYKKVEKYVIVNVPFNLSLSLLTVFFPIACRLVICMFLWNNFERKISLVLYIWGIVKNIRKSQVISAYCHTHFRVAFSIQQSLSTIASQLDHNCTSGYYNCTSRNGQRISYSWRSSNNRIPLRVGVLYIFGAHAIAVCILSMGRL